MRVGGLQAGIRIIITLTNHWPEYGGMAWYVNNTIAVGQPFELFYTDGRVIAAYQAWVRNQPQVVRALYTSLGRVKL